MAEPLWTWDELVAATGGVAEGIAAGGVSGVSIDTRTLQKGDLFVALRGDTQDGRAYVTKAFEQGAGAALVGAEYVTPRGSGPLIRVKSDAGDPVLKAMERLGVAARSRLRDDARVIAVTGSVGKTSTKEMLRQCLSSIDSKHPHASEKSYNNHWGVPLTLARMPRDTRCSVFEIGMNHAHEIEKLSPMVRPHVAIITTVGPVHLGYFKSVEEIAEAKAEIFAGLEPGGVAVLNADNQYFGQLKRDALAAKARVVSFGVAHGPTGPFPDFGASVSSASRSSGTRVQPIIREKYMEWHYEIGAFGDHQVLNSLAALAAIEAIGLDPETCAPALTGFSAGEGRGALLRYPYRGGEVALLDESYNANPISMEAALRLVSLHGLLEASSRRIAVLGDMRELGAASEALHRELRVPIKAAKIDLVFACGPYMRVLNDALQNEIRGAYAERSEGLIAPLLAAIAPGDVIMIKGSLGTRMAPIVEAVKAHLTAWAKKT